MKIRNYLLFFFFAFSPLTLATSLELPEEGVPKSGRFSKCKSLYKPGDCSSFIHLCDDAEFDKQVIVKYMRPEKKHDLDNEIRILSSVKDKGLIHTIGILDVVVEDEKTFLILEYANGGDLLGKILEAAAANKKLRVKEPFEMVMMAIAELHSHRIAHCDIKPDNFFLHNVDGGTYFKIGDFGFSQYIPKGMAVSRSLGTLKYMAPEVYNIDYVREKRPHATYDPFKADIFSAGLVLFTLIAKGNMYKKPCDRDEKFALLKAAGVRGYIEHFKIERRFDEPAIQLLEAMLNFNPKKRPSAEEVLMHPWFNEN